MNEYEDIINTKYPFPSKHPRMKLSDRAAQFAPFSALTGYEDYIYEAGIIRNIKEELDEDIKESINQKLLEIDHNIDKKCPVTITYFQSINNNEGNYITKTVTIKKIDKIANKLITDNEEIILIDDIKDIKIAF